MSLSLFAFFSALGFLIFVIFLSGFSLVEESELAGTYRAEYDGAKETLILRPDGTFIQTGTLEYKSQVLEADGTWRLEKYQGYPYVVLHGSFLNRPVYGRGLTKIESGDGHFPANRLWGRIWLGGDTSDGATEYIKQ